MKSFVYLVVLVAVLGGLFFLFKPDPKPAPPGNTQVAAATAPSAAPAATNVPATPAPAASPAATTAAPTPAPTTFDLVIKRGRLVEGPTVIQVHQGDDVTIRLLSDAADELHLHGYDLHIKTKPGQTVSLQFTAAKTGRFGYELHHAKAELGALEVYPQ